VYVPTVTSIDPSVANLVSLSAANMPLDLERNVRPESAAAPAPSENFGGGLIGRPLEKLQVEMDGRTCLPRVTLFGMLVVIIS